MHTRRTFIKDTGVLSLGSLVFTSFEKNQYKISNPGIQLYTVRNEMLADAANTLKKIAALGFKQIESAGSPRGNYYGLKPKEIKQICADLGMTLRSGHIHISDKWQQTIDEATESGQEYLICSSMPTNGQSVDNYKKTAGIFNRAGEDCNKVNIKFGYHNHDYEFENENGKVLYDVLLENTTPSLVHMELDLGWVIAAGKDPLDYFKKYHGRFPLWHLKDMNLLKKQSTEFGKGALLIKKMFENAEPSGMKYFFMEQEEYASSPFESIAFNVNYLNNLKF